MQPDLFYTKQGLFTCFIPNTTAGETAWRELVSQNEGSPKILTMHLPQVSKQLKAAGYSVKAAPKLSKKEKARELQEIFAEMDQLGI